MTDTLESADLEHLGHLVALAAGRHWTRCDQITVTATGLQLDLHYRDSLYPVTVDRAGTVTGLPDMPAFRRVAVETHLSRLMGH